jgi:hypothetical protein
MTFEHVYLAGRGPWYFEVQWLRSNGRGLALSWKARHSSDTQWRRQEIETGYPEWSSVSDTDLKSHVIRAFAMAESTR